MGVAIEYRHLIKILNIDHCGLNIFQIRSYGFYKALKAEWMAQTQYYSCNATKSLTKGGKMSHMDLLLSINTPQKTTFTTIASQLAEIS